METVRTLFIRRRFQSYDDLWVWILEAFGLGVCRVAASALGRYWAWSAKGCRDPAVRMYHSACVLFSFLFCSPVKLELDGRCLSMQCQSCKSKFLLI